jgi:hypothetical protein
MHPRTDPSLCGGLLLQKGKTPLYIAAKFGQEGVVQLLLGAGAAVDAADEVGPPLPLYKWVDRAELSGYDMWGWIGVTGGASKAALVTDWVKLVCMADWGELRSQGTDAAYR